MTMNAPSTHVLFSRFFLHRKESALFGEMAGSRDRTVQNQSTYIFAPESKKMLKE